MPRENKETSYHLLAHNESASSSELDILEEKEDEHHVGSTDIRGRRVPPSLPTRCIFVVIILLLAGVLSIFLVGAASQDTDGYKDGSVVHTVNGSYGGLHLPDLQQHVFLGIPYAAPPVGPLRFRRPEHFNQSWDGIRDATEYAPNCPGYRDHQERFTYSEDCLAINIIRPTTPDNTPRRHSPHLPVGVFIYGGGVRGGSSSDGRYNLSFLVQAASAADLPFIAVSFNYRASLWGFIDSRQVRGAEQTNIGLYDQRRALHWIQENIAAFGGDPAKVTIFGGSSGADDVGLHLAAFGGRDDGLFRGAILQSGGPMAMMSPGPGGSSQDAYDQLVKKVKCDDSEDSLECLRGVPYKQLRGAFSDSHSGSSKAMVSMSLPAVDGGLVASYGSLAVKHDKFVKVPIMTGVVAHEGVLFVPGQVHDWSAFRSYLIENRHYPPSVADRLMKFYPRAEAADKNADELIPPIKDISSRTEYDRIERLIADVEINAADRLICERYAAASVDCFNFRFDALAATERDERTGATHGTEIGPVFQNTNGIGFSVNPFKGKGEGFFYVSRMMGIAWASFIVNLDPNVGLREHQLQWPKYSPEGGEKLIFNDTEVYVEQDAPGHEAWDYVNSIQHSVLER